ncbi:Uncharacterised protein [Cedecea lapagei]|uniref:Peptidase S74 domain-containing protein n=1 Tax=Cedecea lapagei TaxID=158823 RepID=A0A3S4IDW1_9ENTR|nr:tail fiber domain-containing protein [Cedecea lapagei]VEB97250.1 Uncharacterised protein [Cedecea lapagei]
MIYTTGTIAVNGNTVTGTGTNFTAPGSLIRVGCTLIAMSTPVQVLQITSIDSATQLTVTPAANPALPAGTRYSILLSDSLSVDGLAQSIAETFTMYQRYMSGFADVMNASGDVTITINGQQVTVPGQKSLAKKGNNSDITSLTGLTTALSVAQGGTGGKTPEDARTGMGITNKQLNSLDGKSGGSVTGGITNEAKGMTLRSSDSSQGWFYSLDFQAGQGNNVTFARIYQSNGGINLNVGVNGTAKFNTFDANGNYFCQGNITCVALTQTSDADKKDKIEKITSALDKVSELDGVTYVLNDTGMPSAGVLADALLKVLPECVGSVFDDHDIYEDVEEENADGETVTVRRLIHKRDDSKRSYTVEYSGVIALCVEAIKELNETVKLQQQRIDELSGKK